MPKRKPPPTSVPKKVKQGRHKTSCIFNTYNVHSSRNNLLQLFVKQAKPRPPQQNVRWNNKFDMPLSIECNLNNGEGLFRVRSYYKDYYRDRRWRWDCHKVANRPLTDCSWTHHINTWGGPINRQCKKNYVLTGIKVRETRTGSLTLPNP